MSEGVFETDDSDDGWASSCGVLVGFVEEPFVDRAPTNDDSPPGTDEPERPPNPSSRSTMRKKRALPPVWVRYCSTPEAVSFS